jgi:hypothetical protein
MSSLDVLAFVVWGGGLFNVGFIAGWCAGRRMLRQSDHRVKGSALPSAEPVPAEGPDLFMSGGT